MHREKGHNIDSLLIQSVPHLQFHITLILCEQRNWGKDNGSSMQECIVRLSTMFLNQQQHVSMHSLPQVAKLHCARNCQCQSTHQSMFFTAKQTYTCICYHFIRFVSSIFIHSSKYFHHCQTASTAFGYIPQLGLWGSCQYEPVDAQRICSSILAGT